MTGVYLLIFVPLILFVAAFLYETFLSFARLKRIRAGRRGYVSATWEVTHTLLIFAVVMMLMLFTQSIDRLASAIFMSTFIAATALLVRAMCYIYIFYVRGESQTSWVDWLFAFSHVAAAVFLVITVVEALWFIFTQHPTANVQFVGPFLPGLVLVLALCGPPILTLYRSKS